MLFVNRCKSVNRNWEVFFVVTVLGCLLPQIKNWIMNKLHVNYRRVFFHGSISVLLVPTASWQDDKKRIGRGKVISLPLLFLLLIWNIALESLLSYPSESVALCDVYILTQLLMGFSLLCSSGVLEGLHLASVNVSNARIP